MGNIILRNHDIDNINDIKNDKNDNTIELPLAKNDDQYILVICKDMLMDENIKNKIELC